MQQNACDRDGWSRRLPVAKREVIPQGLVGELLWAAAIPNLVESAVTGLPDDDMGEEVVAVVVSETDASLDAAEIQGCLGDRLVRYKLPRTIVFTREFRCNTVGKVQNDLLRERYSTQPA